MLTTYTLPALPRPCPRTTSIEKTPDEDLLKAIAMGNRQAMGILFARHNVRVYRFIARFTSNASLAEDLVSEVFLAVWAGAKGFKQKSQVSTWLLAIGRHKAIAALRRTLHEPSDDVTRASALVAFDNPETSADETIRSTVIRRCLMQLPLAQREILDLIYYHEKTLEQVAEIVGVPYATVKTRAFYARKRMSELLKLAGIHESRSY